MAKSKPSDPNTTRKSSSWSLALLISILTPVAAAIFLYQLDSFDPASLPTHVFSQEPMSVPRINSRLLHESEMIGLGKLLGPEDIAYDTNSHLIYTGCADGWIKKVTLNDSAVNSVVHDWAFTGGRPLGVVLGRAGEVLVADADKVGNWFSLSHFSFPLRFDLLGIILSYIPLGMAMSGQIVRIPTVYYKQFSSRPV